MAKNAWAYWTIWVKEPEKAQCSQQSENGQALSRISEYRGQMAQAQNTITVGVLILRLFSKYLKTMHFQLGLEIILKSRTNI